MLLFIFLISGFMLSNVNRMIEAFSVVIERDAPSIANANELQKLVVDIETGQRGFVITGKDEFLQPYTEGFRLFNQLMLIQRAQSEGTPEQLQRLNQIEQLLKQWQQQVGEPEIAARREVNRGTVSVAHLQEVVGRGAGKAIIDSMREIAERLANHFSGEGGRGELYAHLTLKAMVDQETGVRGFLISGKEPFLQPYHQGQSDFVTYIRAMRRVETEHPSHNKDEVEQLIDRLEYLSNTWLQQVAIPEIEARREMNLHPKTIEDVALLLETGSGKQIIDQIRTLFEQFIQLEEAAAQQHFIDAQQLSRQVRDLTILSVLLFLLIALLLIVVVTRSITKPVAVLREATTAVGNGELDREINIQSEDEIGDLARSFQQMTHRLLAAQQESGRRIWLEQRLSTLNNAMRGDQQSAELASRIIEQLCHATGAKIGLLYLRVDRDDRGNPLQQPELHCYGNYAYSEHEQRSSRYRWGESLVGQAAEEEKIIHFADVPDDYIKVSSGLGESTPRNIVLAPFLFNGEVLGVIELGTMAPLEHAAEALIEQSLESIAIAFTAATARSALDRALRESQTLTEELQSQQEELQETNELLEEQTQALEISQRDVEARNSQLMEAQETLSQRAEQLSKSSRYKSEFLANMSHELRTPLNSILLLSKMIAVGDIKDEQDKMNNAQIIYDAGSDLLGLINEVLDLSKIESGKMSIHLSTIEVEHFCQSFESLFRPQAEEKGLTFGLYIEPGLPMHLNSDRDRLQQVLRNFLSNAIKFTAQGAVRIEAGEVTETHIDHLVTYNNLSETLRKQPESYIAFSVVDEGIGIAEEKRQLIFEAFQQADGSTSRNFGGTGLGLSISSEIANMLEGAVALQSSMDADNHGSTFTLIVPLEPGSVVKAVAETTVQLEQELAPPVRKSKETGAINIGVHLNDDRLNISSTDNRTLLIIEDDARFAQTLVELGHSNGFKVIHAGNGVEGVKLAEQYLPMAILLDIQLPILDGWGVLRSLKSNPNTSHIPVHVISVVEESQFGYRLGAAQFLTKPVEAEQLQHAFQQIDEQLQRRVKQLLVVEDNEVERESIIKLLNCGQDIECRGVGTGAEAIEALQRERYDTFILDLNLPDMSGYEVLKQLAEDEAIERTPVIVYTGQDLSLEEEKQLRQYAESIVLKTVESPARLLEETTIFLHRVRSELSEEKQQLLKEVTDLDDHFNGHTILLVDDDIRNTYALSALLEKRGLNVLTAADGKEALQVLDEHVDEIEMVLMDVMMPVMDGHEATRKIREQARFQQLPIIALTAKATAEDREHCIESGASDYMSKPIDHDQLISLIRVWLSTMRLQP